MVHIQTCLPGFPQCVCVNVVLLVQCVTTINLKAPNMKYVIILPISPSRTILIITSLISLVLICTGLAIRRQQLSFLLHPH